MIELVFLACLSSQPEVCEDRAMQFTDLSLMTCLLGAQPQLARWQGEHPDWTVQRWRCQATGPERRT